VLGLGASLAFHAGVACFAFQHGAHEPATRAALELRRPALEISIVTSVEPAPIVEARAPHAANARALGTPRAALAAKVPVSPMRAAVADEHTVPTGSAEPAASAAPRFTLQAPVVTAAINATSIAANQAGVNAPFRAAPVPETQVDTPAKLQAGNPPSYTAAAEAAGIEVELPLEVVIDAGGVVQSARSLGRVGYGLDEAALAAIRRYRFSPARRAGNAVAVRMRWVMRFQLR
jgi:protein TonB